DAFAPPASSSDMSPVLRNIIANFVGKGGIAVLTLLFPPLYARWLGIEAYGLVGVYLTLTAVLSVLDLGLSTTLGREIARLSVADRDVGKQMVDLVRSLEVVFWLVGSFAGLAIALFAPLLAGYWIRVRALDSGTVEASVRLMGLVFALQWPAGLYNGGLLGLQ